MRARLSDEQEAFAEAIRDFCARECGTREQRQALTHGGRLKHSPELYSKMAELGWVGVELPEEYGGGGGTIVDLCVLLEETARGMAPTYGGLTTPIVAASYEKFGTEDQKREILGGVCRGAVEAIGMSEPEAGSDVGSLSCRATRQDGGFVINGQKTWLSNARIAAHILVVCRTATGENKHDGLTMFVVPPTTDGIEIRPIETIDGDAANDVFFTDCYVPESAVLGEVDQGWRQLMSGLNTERLILSASMLGTAERALDDTLDYISQRRQFGRPVGSFQALKHRIADLATELKCAKLLLYDVAEQIAEQPERMLPREASMVKLKVTETAKQISLEGLQMMGGYGAAREYDMQSHVRQSLVATVFGGTSEIQREIISKSYGL
jgi:alkylation response protein AidB-like acyl-CoA dehydrogenase